MLDYINFMMTYLSMTSSECCEISLNVNLLTDLKHYIHFMHINHHYDCLNRVAFDLGQTAFINCRMQAFPAPRFDWTFGNSILSNDRSFYDSNMTELNDDIYEATLKINQVSQSSYGDYICKGQNTMGAKRTIIKLQVRIVEDIRYALQKIPQNGSAVLSIQT